MNEQTVANIPENGGNKKKKKKWPKERRREAKRRYADVETEGIVTQTLAEDLNQGINNSWELPMNIPAPAQNEQNNSIHEPVTQTELSQRPSGSTQLSPEYQHTPSSFHQFPWQQQLQQQQYSAYSVSPSFVFDYHSLMSVGYGLPNIPPQPSITHSPPKSHQYTTQYTTLSHQTQNSNTNPVGSASAIQTNAPNRPSIEVDQALSKLNLSNKQEFHSDAKGSKAVGGKNPRRHFKAELKDISQVKFQPKASTKSVKNGQHDTAISKPEETEIQLPAPKPTDVYLQVSENPAQKLDVNPQFKKKLLVILDLNGTLLFRRLKQDGRKDNRHPISRPYLSQFLDYIFTEHHVVIYSSAFQSNVLRLLRAVIPRNKQKKILRIFSREDMDLPFELLKHKVTTYKRLSVIWEALEGHHFLWKFSQMDTVLIDDSKLKASSEPYNHLEIPDFTREVHLQGNDDALKKAIGYLEILRQYDNVSAYIREHPFSLENDYTIPS